MNPTPQPDAASGKPATDADRELALQIGDDCANVSVECNRVTLDFDVSKACHLIAAHVRARVEAETAKERQARELAEGALVEARKGWAYFAGWSASSQKYEVCHWQGRDSNVPKFDTLEAAWEEAERRSIAARVNGLMPLAPAPAGGEPE